MKKIFLLLILSISINSFSQDSSRTKISVTIAAKDCEYVVKTFEKTAKFEDIDSVLKKKFRVPSPPTGNTGVQIDSVEARVWLHVFTSLSGDFIAMADTNKVWKRVNDALRIAGSGWLNHKMDNVNQNKDEQSNTIRILGRNYLRKQEN